MPVLNIWDTTRGNLAWSIPGPPSALAALSAQLASQLGGATFGTLGFANMTATRDPGATDDVSAGYVPGSIWYNATAGALRWWECYSNAAGAAQWVFSGAYYAGGGTNPNTEATQAGSSTASIAAEGNIYREALLVGVPNTAGAGRAPTVTGSGAFQVLGIFQIPASAFDGGALTSGTGISNRGINIQANGSLGATANTKRILLVANPVGAVLNGTLPGGFNGQVIADSGPITVNGSGWCIAANIFKVGVLGSNTQIALHEQFQAGPSVSPLLSCTPLTLPENAVITIALVAACTTAANDVVYQFMEGNFMN